MDDQVARILGVRFDLIDYDRTLAMIHQWRRCGDHKYVTIANPHSTILCRRRYAMRHATAGAALTLPDGIGIIFAANLLGYRHEGRITGPSLMLRLCEWGLQHQYRHFFFGGKDGVAARLARRLVAQYPGLEVAGAFSPPFRAFTAAEDQDFVARVNSTRPDVLWVGLGAPKQEEWMARHLGRIHTPVMIGVGAAFDFHSGNVQRAPAAIRKVGLEWLYRTSHEPNRIGPKALDNLIFAFAVLCEAVVVRLVSGNPLKKSP